MTEEQQAERARQWVRENGLFILAGVVLGLGGLFGWQAWNDYQTEQSGQASTVWSQLVSAIDGERANEVSETLALLEKDYAGTPYMDQARLAMAKYYMDRNEVDNAAAELQALADDGRDPGLQRVAELRLAQIHIANRDFAAARAVLGAADDSAFAPLYYELTGDIAWSEGRFNDAREAYERALELDRSGVIDRSYVQVKLDDAIGSVPGSVADSVADAAAPESAE